LLTQCAFPWRTPAGKILASPGESVGDEVISVVFGKYLQEFWFSNENFCEVFPNRAVIGGFIGAFHGAKSLIMAVTAD
jgi:hypothetical protein